MDPTAAKFRGFYGPRAEVIADFYSAAEFKAHFGTRKAKLITSIAMFYDLDDPIQFVEQVAEVLHDDGIWHFEQSYLPAMLAQNACDTICHEHVEYYTLKQIKWMTDSGGLKVLDVEVNDVNGGSFAVTVAKTSSHMHANTAAVDAMLKSEDDQALHTLNPYRTFRERVFRHREELLATLDDLSRRGAKVLGYGASTKGNVILQFCGIPSALILLHFLEAIRNTTPTTRLFYAAASPRRAACIAAGFSVRRTGSLPPWASSTTTSLSTGRKNSSRKKSSAPRPPSPAGGAKS
jgi:hypothetical protein